MLSAEDFLNDTVAGSNATSYTPVPKGEYPAMISKVEYRVMDSKVKPGEKNHVIDVTFVIDDATARDVTGLPEPTVRQSIFLDVSSDNKLDMSKGKNVNLGRLREALGMNDPDKPFSFNHLKGQACYVTVEHNPSTKDPRDVFANVGKVGKSPTGA